MEFRIQIQELFSEFENNDFYLCGNWFEKSLMPYIKWQIKFQILPFSDHIVLVHEILRHMVKMAGL